MIDLLEGSAPWRRYTVKNAACPGTEDVLDWLGGYPFEVATPEVIVT